MTSQLDATKLANKVIVISKKHHTMQNKLEKSLFNHDYVVISQVS